MKLYHPVTKLKFSQYRRFGHLSTFHHISQTLHTETKLSIFNIFTIPLVQLRNRSKHVLRTHWQQVTPREVEGIWRNGIGTRSLAVTGRLWRHNPLFFVDNRTTPLQTILQCTQTQRTSTAVRCDVELRNHFLLQIPPRPQNTQNTQNKDGPP